MVFSTQIKGYLLSLIGALALSNVYIFSKAALNEIHLVQFGFYWFGLGLIWNLAYFFKTGNYNDIKNLSRSSIWILVLIGIIELVATVLFFLAIEKIESPAIVSFIANLNPLFVTIMGITILKERFNKTELAGIILTIVGTFVICYHVNTGFSGLLMKGSSYIIIAAILYAVSIIITKRNIKRIQPSFLATNRVVFLFVLSVIFLIASGKTLAIPASAIKNIAIGSFLGPFLNAITYYLAIKYIEAARATMVRSSRSIFVLIGAYLYFGLFPAGYQVVGGLITIIGIILISFGKTRLLNSRIKR